MTPQGALALDPTTLLFTISILGFATAAFAFSSSRAIGAANSGLTEWGFAMTSVGVSFLLYFLRGHAPLLLSYFVASCAVMAVPAFALLAHTRFFGVAPRRRLILALCVLGVSGPGAVQLAPQLPLGVGVFTMSLGMAALLLMNGVLIVREKGLKVTAPSSFAAVTILLLALVCAVRAVVAVLGQGESVSLAADRSRMAWPLVIGTLFVVVATIGFVMMVHDKQRRTELQSARRDPLTGLHARAAFFEALAAIQANGDESFALVVLDIDRFKGLNDAHGHSAGDLVLAQAGRLIAGSIRAQDVAGRFGGDEFCIVLRHCGAEQAQRFAERLVQEAARQSVPLPGGIRVGFTMSAGYATRLPRGSDGRTVETAEQLFERADAALYQAKRSGRTRAVGANDETVRQPVAA